MNPYLDQARELLSRFYGYRDFRPAQVPVIESLLTGHDALAIMPTGAGKSICFQIPALIFPGLTLVISPLISLMKDQVDALAEQGIPATYINSSLSLAESDARLSAIAQGRYKLVYVAPERLSTSYFQYIIDKQTISMVAVAEAHSSRPSRRRRRQRCARTSCACSACKNRASTSRASTGPTSTSRCAAARTRRPSSSAT